MHGRNMVINGTVGGLVTRVAFALCVIDGYFFVSSDSLPFANLVVFPNCVAAHRTSATGTVTLPTTTWCV